MTAITLRSKTTGQENHFDNEEGARNFIHAVENPSDWTDEAATAADDTAADAGDAGQATAGATAE